MEVIIRQLVKNGIRRAYIKRLELLCYRNSIVILRGYIENSSGSHHGVYLRISLTDLSEQHRVYYSVFDQFGFPVDDWEVRCFMWKMISKAQQVIYRTEFDMLSWMRIKCLPLFQFDTPGSSLNLRAQKLFQQRCYTFPEWYEVYLPFYFAIRQVSNVPGAEKSASSLRYYRITPASNKIPQDLLQGWIHLTRNRHKNSSFSKVTKALGQSIIEQLVPLDSPCIPDYIIELN
jgi:hypothetical protein